MITHVFKNRNAVLTHKNELIEINEYNAERILNEIKLNLDVFTDIIIKLNNSELKRLLPKIRLHVENCQARSNSECGDD